MEEEKNIAEEELKQHAEGENEAQTQSQEVNDKEAETNGQVDNNDETADVQDENTEKSPLEAAQEEIAELKDKYLRSIAEFDNYRKRTLKEKSELILNGSEKAITAILPIIDDMERALENGKNTDDAAVLREGIELIYSKFCKTLEGLGLKRIDTENADFDTDVHEAIAMVPGMGDDKKGKVLDCVQAGYKLNDKVIRHAKVAVGQ